MPAGGVEARRHAIAQVSDYEGEILYDFNRDEPAAKRIVSEQAVSSMNRILTQIPVIGTAKRAALEGGIVTGGKTGTSQSYRDAWFIGFTGNYTAAVWFGNDDFTSMNNMTGGSLPAMTFKKLMDYAHQGIELKPIPVSTTRFRVATMPLACRWRVPRTARTRRRTAWRSWCAPVRFLPTAPVSCDGSRRFERRRTPALCAESGRSERSRKHRGQAEPDGEETAVRLNVPRAFPAHTGQAPGFAKKVIAAPFRTVGFFPPQKSEHAFRGKLPCLRAGRRCHRDRDRSAARSAVPPKAWFPRRRYCLTRHHHDVMRKTLWWRQRSLLPVPTHQPAERG